VNDPAANWHPETVEIKNNIFYNQSNCRYIGLDSTLANVTVDANCYYGGSGNPPSQDTRQVNGDPQFVDAASFNFHLKGTSPCTGKGAAPASFAIRDYDGFVRRPGTTDIGAVQQYVAGASAVTPPTGTYAISGYVNDASSSGIRGVTVALSAGASQVATTAENGFYQFVDLAPESSYTITPSKSNWRFAPAAMNVTLVSESLVNRDFSGTPLATYAISGYLRDAAGAPLSGAAVTISGGKTVTAVTDVSGFYIFPSLAGGESYGVVISKDGFTFTPALRSISALTGDAAAEDFTGIYTAGISPGEVRIIGSTASRGAINPDKGETAKIVYNGSGTGTFECRIFTLTGEMVWQDTRNDSSKGIFEWAPRDIASGVYAVSVKGPGVNARKKVSVIR
jgi:hypothetical protein